MRLQPFRQFTDRCPGAARIVFDVKQQQILQRRDAFALRGLFGKTLEASHLIAELGQLFEIRLGKYA